ncbi:MAG TPA: lipopolysaccharide biosynthesis protein [Candidatus Angelobacter sp.]|nr:lipopolysaccharide biosynthesis protein [Candidatus Angelobacter sp.]
MPLSEAERDVLASEARSAELPKPSSQWLGWTDALYRLWLQRFRILRWGLIGLVLSIPVAWRYPKYESTIQIMPPDSGTSGLAAMLPALSKSPALMGFAGDIMGAKTTGAVFMKVLDSRTVKDDLIDRFDLKKRYGSTYMESARKKLTSRTIITEDKKSGVIAISVIDRDKDLAHDMAKAYVDELDAVTARVSTSAARRERIFIEQRLAEENKTLQDAEQQFSQFASTNMALDVPEQTKVTVEAAARLQGELIATKAQLEGLKETYTDENIRVKSAQAHINELERALAKINAGHPSASQDPSNPYPSVKNLPLLGVKWADLYRNTKIRETVVEMLTQQYEMARIQEAKEIPTVKVLDPASTPEQKQPSWLMIVLGGFVIGMALACLGYFVKNWWERWDHDDPRRMLLVQVFGRSRTNTGSRHGFFARRPAKQDEMQ